MNWFGNRKNEEFIFKRVSWDNWQEHETYNYITSGSIEYAADAELKVSGKFEFEGYDIPDTNDLIRVYYRFTEGSESVEIALATFFMSYSSINYLDTLKGIKASGSINGESVLTVLKNKQVGRPFTIKKGTYSIVKAWELIEECGLRYSAPTLLNNMNKLTSDYTFKATDNYLTIVNYLMGVAQYKDVYPDENGIIQMEPIPQKHNKIVFKNDDNSIMYPELSADNNWMSTPNVVKILYNTDTACILATAKNITGSRASLNSRGNREITYVEEVSNVGNGSIRKLLKEKAENVLKEKSSDIEYVKFQHALVPMGLYDNVNITYGSMNWEGSLDNFSIELIPSVPTVSRVKKILDKDIVIDSNIQIYREE